MVSHQQHPSGTSTPVAAPVARAVARSKSRRGYGAVFWRPFCQDLADADLAGLLRERLRWRDDQRAQLPDWVREWADAGNEDAIWYAGYWDDAVAWGFEAITLPLVEEVIRRLARSNQRRASHLTTEQLVAAFSDRLQPTGNGRYRTQCPWHEDTHPSLVVFADGWCHCFPCGAHRPVSDLAVAWKEQAA